MNIGTFLQSFAVQIRKRMPRREDVATNKWLAPVAGRALSPELWRFTRRSVPRGVALGLFAAFIVPIGQIFLACLLALPARANVAVAAVVTLVTNPLTIAFWFVVANRVGQFFLRSDGAEQVAHSAATGSSLWDDINWFAHTAGEAAVGFVVLAIVSAALGYLVAGWVWRYWIGHKHRERRMRKPRQSAGAAQARGAELAESSEAERVEQDA